MPASDRCRETVEPLQRDPTLIAPRIIYLHAPTPCRMIADSAGKCRSMQGGPLSLLLFSSLPPL